MTEIRPSVKEQKLSELLHNENTFMVPTYQRDYAWEVEQVQALTEDLEHFNTGEEQYYILGQIIIAENESSSNAKHKYAIVDGQQRLTTLFLLFIAIKKVFQDFGIGLGNYTDESRTFSEIDRILFRTNPQNGNTQQRLVPCSQAQPAIEDLLNSKSLEEVQPNSSSKNVKQNFEHLSSWVRETFKDSAALTRFTNKVIYEVYLISVTVESESQALSVFEKINNRGMPLNSADLLKYLIFQDAPAKEFEIINQRWAEAGEALFGAKPHAISSVQYLMQAMLQPETGKFIASKNVHTEWKEIFKAQKGSDRFSAGKFSDEILSSARNLSLLASARPTQLNSEFVGSKYFSAIQHFPVALTAWNISNGDEVLYREISQIIDARVVLNLFAAEGSQYLNTVMWKWSKALNDVGRGQTLDQYIKAIDIQTASINQLFSDANSKFKTFNYTNSKDKKRIRFALALIANHVERISKREDNDKTLRQLLESNSRSANRYDIDHVFAKSLVNAATYNQTWGADWVNNIGNLCLMHANDNRTAGVVPPTRKSQSYATSKLLLTQLLAESHDVPALGSTSSQAGRVASQLRQAGAEDVSYWDPEVSNKQADYYFELFKDALSTALHI